MATADIHSRTTLNKALAKDGVMPRKEMPGVVTIDEFLEANKKFFQAEAGYALMETTSEDMDEINKLLGTSFTEPYWIKTKEGFEHCPDCGRENNFLDVVKTGLRVHSAEFMKKVFAGHFGPVLNPQRRQPCHCAQCGLLLPMEAPKFSAAKLPTSTQGKEATNSFGGYEFPVYIYRF